MGQINLIHDESWRAAKLVVNHFETRLDDAELLEAFRVVREVITESLSGKPDFSGSHPFKTRAFSTSRIDSECLQQTLERRERELRRLAKTNELEN